MRVENIEGIGAETAQKLNGIGIYDTNDLRGMSWQSIAYHQFIGAKKVVALYANIGINITEKEVQAYKDFKESKAITKRQIVITPAPAKNYGEYQLALAEFLEINPEYVERREYDYFDEIGMECYEIMNDEKPRYIIGSEDEADKAVAQVIEEDLSFMNTWFLVSHMKNIENEFDEAFEEKEKILSKRDDLDEDLENGKITQEEYDEKEEEIYEEADDALSYVYSQVGGFTCDVEDVDSIVEYIKDEFDEMEASEKLSNMVDDMDDLVEDAVSQDGRGHFLNHWDGSEEEVDYDGETYYIYRTN